MTVYRIDGRQGRFSVQAFAEGMLSTFGHNPTLAIRDFSGQLEFDADVADRATLQVTVQATSLEVMGDISKKDRQEIETRTRDEVLEATKFPQIVFGSTSVEAQKIADNQYRLQVSGKLKLHGVEREQKIDLQARLGESDARLRGEFRLKQSDFKIKRISAVGGAIRVKDELQSSFEIVAKRSEGARSEGAS